MTLLQKVDEACKWLETMATGANIHKFRSLSNKLDGWKTLYENDKSPEIENKIEELLTEFRKERVDLVMKTPFPRWG